MDQDQLASDDMKKFCHGGSVQNFENVFSSHQLFVKVPVKSPFRTEVTQCGVRSGPKLFPLDLMGESSKFQKS